MQAVVERNDWNACSFNLRVPVLLHWHAEEEGCQDDAGAPDSDDGDEDVDLPVEISRGVGE